MTESVTETLTPSPLLAKIREQEAAMIEIDNQGPMQQNILNTLREYIRESVAAVTAFLGGAFIFIAGLLLDLSGHLVPMPYMTFGSILLMIGGQYWAYHKQRTAHLQASAETATRIATLEAEVRKLSGPRPEIDERLELVEAIPVSHPYHQSRIRNSKRRSEFLGFRQDHTPSTSSPLP